MAYLCYFIWDLLPLVMDLIFHLKLVEYGSHDLFCRHGMEGNDNVQHGLRN